VCIQVLLLREHGFQVDYGMLWFAGDRRRVKVVVDDALVIIVRGAILRAKEITRDAVMPRATSRYRSSRTAAGSSAAPPDTPRRTPSCASPRCAR